MGRSQGYLEEHLEQLGDLVNAISNQVGSLEWDLDSQPEDPVERAVYMRDVVLRDMLQLRQSCDQAEAILPKEGGEAIERDYGAGEGRVTALDHASLPKDIWPIPTYTDLVHYV